MLGNTEKRSVYHNIEPTGNVDVRHCKNCN